MFPFSSPGSPPPSLLCPSPVLRRKAREQKAYAKQVQAEKQKERAQEKKRQIQQVQQLRKQREKSVSATKGGGAFAGEGGCIAVNCLGSAGASAAADARGLLLPLLLSLGCILCSAEPCSLLVPSMALPHGIH